MGDGEPIPYERMKVSPKVQEKPVLNLPDCPRGEDYVVRGGTQDVPRWVIVHHEGVVTSVPQIIGTAYEVGYWS